MPIYISSVSVVAANTIRVQYSESVSQDYQAFLPSNYAFSTRYGDEVPIYSRAVELYSATAVTVYLRDAMLTNGHYLLAVSNVSGLDGVKIEAGPGPREMAFEGAGDPLTVFQIKGRVPPWWNTRMNSRFYGLLYGIGKALDIIMGKGQQLEQIADGLSLRTATGEQLSIIGQNLGAIRPEYLLTDDAMYRQLIPVFATKKKAVLAIFYEALTIALGDQATKGWKIYEMRPNELLIELPADLYFGLAPGTLRSATYFHDSDAGTSTGVGSGYLDDTSKAWAINRWAGKRLVDSATVVFTIVSNTATRLTVSSGTPTAGAYSILDFYPPSSYPGDYLLTDYTDPGTDVGSNTVQLFQQTVIDDIVSRLKAASISIVVTTV